MTAVFKHALLMTALMAGLGFSSSARAATWGNYSVSGVGCSTNGGWCHATVTTNVASGATCTDRRRIYWNPSTAAGDSMTSVFMSAFLAGKRVRLWMSDNTCRTFEDSTSTGFIALTARITD